MLNYNQELSETIIQAGTLSHLCYCNSTRLLDLFSALQNIAISLHVAQLSRTNVRTLI